MAFGTGVSKGFHLERSLSLDLRSGGVPPPPLCPQCSASAGCQCRPLNVTLPQPGTTSNPIIRKLQLHVL